MIADTLYAKYILERDGQNIIEDGDGFIIYKVSGAECFIVEMFVNKEARRAGHGRSLIERLASLVPECTIMTANIWPHKPGSSDALLGALRVGFEVKRADAGVLLIAKDLMEV